MTPDASYLLAAIGISAGITWSLRAVPFALLAPLRRNRMLPYLGREIPVGILTILVLYRLRHVDVTAVPATTAIAAALIVTVGLHLWRRNMVLSILAGTAVHVLLASLTVGPPD